MASNSEASIAIVGAGVSGLSAAIHLADGGYRNITIFEARREAGGRTRSYLDAKTGDTLDNGQHLLMGCYSQTLDYLRRIGTSDKVERTRGLRIPFYGLSGNPRVLSVPPVMTPPLNLLIGLWRSDLLSANDKIAASLFGRAVRMHALPADLKALSCSQLFEKLRQPSSLVRKLWEPIVLATINAGPDEASAEVFINTLREIFFGKKGACDLLIPKVGLGELLIEPAINQLEATGAAIRMGCGVKAMHASSGGIRVESEAGEESFDCVIHACNRFDNLPASIGMPTFKSSPIVNAYFWIDRMIFRSPINGFIGTKLQWVFPKQSIFAAQRLALTVSAADDIIDETTEEIAARLWNEIRQSVPDATRAKLLHVQVIKEKRATIALSAEANRLRPTTMTEHSRLFMAGDIVQNGLPATIEGSIRNGYLAAQQVERALNT